MLGVWLLSVGFPSITNHKRLPSISKTTIKKNNKLKKKVLL